MYTLATDLSLLSQINLIFYIALGLAILIGILRGFKKSLFTFITMAIFYVVFFLTINSAVNMLWSMNMPWLGSYLSQIDPSLSSFTSFQDSIENILQVIFGGNVDIANASDDMILLGTGIVQFGLKLVWTVLYFTVILFIYKIICLIIRLIFLRSKKGEGKNRILGAVVGTLNGVMAVFVLMIIFSGFMSITNSVASVLADSEQQQASNLAFPDRSRLYEASYQLVTPSQLAVTTEETFPVEDIQAMVDAYNNNFLVKLADMITTKSVVNPGQEVPLSINLFDTVLSFNYKDDTIAIRYELETLGRAAGTIINSGFIDSGDIADISSDDVRQVFTDLSNSKFVVSLMPIAIEYFANSQDQSIPITVDDIDNIDFQEELNALGDIFVEIVDSGLTLADLEDSDISGLLDAASNINLTILMESKLITDVLINILSGESSIEGLDMLTIPDDVVWRDTYDTDGNLVQAGELRNILVALNAITNLASSVDLNNLSVEDIINMDDATIDDLFGSKVIRATVTDLIGDLDLAGSSQTALVFPDSIYDSDGYFTKSELTSLIKAIKLLVDDSGAEVTFDVLKTLNLTSTEIDTLLSSDIIAATVGNLLYNMDNDPLIIPSTAVSTINVDSVSQSVVSKTEIKNILQALAVLNISNFDNITFDAGIFDNLANAQETALDSAKIDTLLDSSIIHATVSDMILNLSTDNGGALDIPEKNVLGNDLVTTSGGVDLLSKSELGNIFQALYIIDITNLDNINLEDTSLLIDNSDVLLDSAIIHATVSKQILDTSAITVPEKDSQNNSILITQGTTTYIDSDELTALFDALDLLGVTNPTTFASAFDIANMDTLAEQDTLLASAIMHASISKTLLDVDPTVLIIPAESETDQPIKFTTNSLSPTTYVVKDEIKALINAFVAMGLTDLNSFDTEFSTTQFLDNSATVLLSSSLQATLSDMLLNSSSGNLVVPDEDELNADIRVAYSDVTYIRLTELNDLITSLNMLSTNNIDSFDVTPTEIFAFNDTELDTFLASYIMQATISDKVFIGATSESAPVAGKLLVPTYFREAILVGGNNEEQIEKAELKNLIKSLSVLEISSFNGDVSATDINSLTDTEIDQLLMSGSMHSTIDNMLKSNSNINASIPNIAKSDVLYPYLTDIILKDEIKSFILAAQQLGTDISSINIQYSDLGLLTPTQQDTVLSSMIVRCKLTPDLETAAAIKLMTLNASDYETGSIPSTLTKATALLIIS